MFGGFDGRFYDDLHVLDFQTHRKINIQIQNSSITQDYCSLVGSQENADIVFCLNPGQHWNHQVEVHAHKGLILFRLVHREIQALLPNSNKNQKLEALIDCDFVSPFIRDVFKAQQGERIILENVNCKQSLLHLLEFLYCDKFPSFMTVAEIKLVADLCHTLNLKQTYAYMKKMVDYGQHKLQNQVTLEINQNIPAE